MQSTQRTALLCPSATWTHCSVDERLLLVGGTGLMMPLENTHTHTHQQVWAERGAGSHPNTTGVMHNMQIVWLIGSRLQTKNRRK